MLVLSRKIGERIRIGDGIYVMVVRVSQNSVRLGIDAPPGVSILREELTEAELAGIDGKSEFGSRNSEKRES